MEDHILLKDQISCLRKAMKRLLPSERQLLTDFYFRGVSLLQLAAQRGTSIGSIKQRKRRGMLRLRQAFKAMGA
jgi:DNA-directed RNA polymerase specialized sigma24 family protein